MEDANWRKVVQKQVYDLISHRYGLLVLLVGTILIVVSAFHFGESVVEWSTEKYAVVFNSFSDNLAGKSYRERLCLPVPIDVVYTWVNGSDPDLVRNLKRLKLEMQDQLNTSRIHRNSKGEVKCVFHNCIQSNSIALYPSVPVNFTLYKLAVLYTEFSSAQKMYTITSPVDYKNYSIVTFPDMELVKPLSNKTLWIDGQNTTVIQCYITSDATVQNGIPLTDEIVMSGFPHTLSENDLVTKLTEKYQSKIEKVTLNTDKGIAVLHVPVKENYDSLLSSTNFTIDGKQPTFHAAHLVWDLRDLSRDEDISASRFEDNEELRYSLRSLERFAPWIRHIYIVTNGQLPYWLNLENPRITIVTHEEIFPNKSHLPSFGSPAIESNLHRIPGLSDKFIYMNDDVMFGKEVWPDDFYTHSSGQKIYLTWPVPNCNEGCPSSWIKDGYCDKACNVSECEWDAGDCDGANANLANAGWAGGWNSDTSGYCNSGCANNWIADRYCDTACNVLECGFDAGDCGTDKYNQLDGLTLLPNQTLYTLPPGSLRGYFNLSLILSEVNTTIKSAQYDDNKVIRTIAIAKKFQVLTVLLHKNFNQTSINFTLEYGKVNHTKQLNFSLNVNTKAVKVMEANLTKSDSKTNDTVEDKKVDKVTTETPAVFEDIPHQLEEAGVVMPTGLSDISMIRKELPSNWSTVNLPSHLRQQYIELTQELNDEELTEVGYIQRLQLLWKSFQDYLLHNKTEKNEEKMSNKGPIVAGKPSDRLNNQERSHDMRKIHGQKRFAPSSKRIIKDGQSKVENEAGVQKEAGSQKEAQVQKEAGVQKKAGVENEAHNQNEADIIQVNENFVRNPAGRNLLFDNEINSPVEMYIDDDDGDKDDDDDDSSFIEPVDIQPDSVRLLPWETGSLAELQKKKEIKEEYESISSQHHGRHLLDTFGDSLRHVNALYNKAFGYTARKVPGHMPHMIDKHIMDELQTRFPAEWEATSSHKVRHSKDMQFAFSYFYYLMGVKQNVTASDVFDEMDTDKSKILSDREIRTLATRLYDLPLDLQTLSSLENMFVNCSRNIPLSKQDQPDAGDLEQYYEKDMPQVTRNLFINCHAISEIIGKKFPSKSKYKHVEVDDSQIAFKMIKTNISIVVGQLDDIRKNPKKFICLNDNIDHTQDQARTIKAILADFYESFFPIQSQFELPREYRNRFTHIDELREWRSYRDWLKFWTHIALILLVLFTIASYFSDKIEAAQRRFARRRSPGDSGSNDGSEGQGYKDSKYKIETV